MQNIKVRTVYARISDIKAGIDEDGVDLGMYSGKMAELGFNVLDTSGKLRNMGEVVQQIGSKWASLTREQQVNLAQVMAGQRQYSNLIALFDNFDKYNEALNTAQNAAGTLQSQQDTYMESTAAHLEILHASVENIYDSLFSTDGMEKLIDGLTDAANALAKFIDLVGGGGNLLRSLGAIGMMVFGTQIARGLNTTITNLEMAKINATEFQQRLQVASQWKGIPGLDKLSKDILENRQQLMEFSKYMTPDQFVDFQNRISEIDEMSKKIAGLQKQVSLLQPEFKKFSNGKSFMDIAGNADAERQVSENIQKQIQGLKNLENQSTSVTAKMRDNFNDYEKSIKNADGSFQTLNKNAALFQKTNIFEPAKQNLQQFTKELSQLASEGKIQTSTQQIKNLQTEIRNLSTAETGDPSKLSDLVRNYEQVGQKLRDIASQNQDVLQNMSGRFQEAFTRGTAGELDQAITDVERRANAFWARIEAMNRPTQIEVFTKMAGGIASLGMAIKQFQSLGSIWSKKQQDVPFGEKLLQTIITLGMSISMAVPAIVNLQRGFTNLGMAQAFQAAAAKAAALANKVLAGQTTILGAATEFAAAAQHKLNAAISANPYFVGAAAIALIIGAVGALNKAVEENRKATIQNSRATIEEQDAKQKSIQSQRELYNSLDDLNKKYQEGEISRAELRSEIDNLVNQYDLEDNKVQELKRSYNDLTETIIRHRREAAEDAEESAQAEQAAAKEALIATGAGLAKDEKTKDFAEQGIQNTTKISFYNRKTTSDQEKQILEESGLGTRRLINRENSQDLMDLYEDVLKALQLYEKSDIKDFRESQTYKKLSAAADYLRKDAEEYKANQEELDQYRAELQAWENEENHISDFYGIDNGIDYVKQRLNLIEQIKTDLNKSKEEAEKMADVFLRDNFNSLYSQFSELGTYTDSLKEKFGQLDDEALKALNELTPDQLAFIEDLDISHWKQLMNVLEYMNNTDWSRLNIIANPSAAIQSAKSNFDRYKDLSDQYYEGKQISIKKDEDFEKLAPQVQAFFETMEDGTHVMMGNAKEFNEVVKSLELADFKQNAAVFKTSQERLEKLQNTDINDYTRKAIDITDDFKFDSDEHMVHFDQNGEMAQYLQQQLDILTEFGHDVSEIAGWQALLSDGQASISTITRIAKAVEDYSNQTDKLTLRQKENESAMLQNEIAIGKTADSMKELRQYLDEGLIGQKAFTKAAIELDESLDLEGLDRKELEEFGDHLQEIATSSDELADSLQKDEDAANIVAKSIMKMNRGVEALAKNWEDWSDILANSSESSGEYLEAMDGTKDAMADLLDINKDFISESFIKDHLAEIGEAAQGSETAIDGLKAALAEDIITRIMVENGIDEAQQAEILANLASLQAAIPDIEVGASLETGAFLEQAQALIDACGLTADQANALFDSIGFEATFATEPQEVQQRTPNMVTETQVTGYTTGFAQMATPGGVPLSIPWSYPILSQNTYQKGYSVHSGVIDVPAMSTNGKTPKIQSLTKKAGGSFNNGSSRNLGGNNSGSGNKGKGGGGKGSGGKAPEPDTSQKDRKKDMEDTRDIYHDINIELEQINRRLDRAQKKQDRLYGKQLLDNLNEQTKILEQHKAALEEKHKLQEQDLKNQQETLKNLGVTFDEYGNISNYMSILGRKQAEINARTKEYNSLIDAYNASTDKDLKKAISEEAEKLNKKIKEYEDDYKNLEKKIKDYDGLREDMEDVVDQIEEETQKQIEINIKKFRMAIEIRLEMGDAERDWNQFRREVLEHTDVLKDTDFEKIFADARQNMRDVFSYFDVHGTKGTLQALTEQLMNTRAEIEAINETGKSAIYGDNKAQAMEDLQKDLNELMGQMEDVEKLIDDIGEAYLDTIDDIADQFDEQIEDYEYIGDLIEHDIDLLQLLYGDKNYDAMQKYYDTLTQNNLRQLDSLRQQRDFWKQEWDMAVARGDTQAAKEFEQNYKETIENLNDAVEDAAKNIQDKYINAIDKIFDELDKKITNGKGTDYLSTEWDLMNKNAEEYLDTINSAFAIQETERKYQKAIDESKNIKNQQTLKKLMDDQLDILRNKEKVSQYDVDRAEKLLQVEQARIALQDAQSAKTTLRLKRDSQGNYSYQYVADNNAVDDARDNLAQAQNDLYNFDKERYQSVLDDMLNAWKDFQSDYKDILEDTSLAEQDRIERLALLREEYGEYINDKTAQNMEARQNLMESAFADLAALYNTDVANYNQMSADEQNILMNDLVPAWESGIQQMSDKVAGEGGFIPACEEAFDDITEKTKEYEEQLDNMANAAGISLDYVTQGVDLLSDAFMNLVEDNDELIDRMYTEVDAIQTLQDAARELVNEYQNIYNEAKTAVSEIHNFIQQEQGRAAAYADTANVAIDSYNRTARAYVDAYDQMASAVENYAARVRAAISGDSGSGGGNGSGGGANGSGRGTSGSPASSTGTSLQGKTHTSTTWENGRATQVNWYYDENGNIIRMASGGYTGNWNSSEGKVAILHQKELVLNEDDTKNFLEGTHILREISSSLQGSLSARMSNVKLSSLMSTDKEELEQNVHIEASFPNVNSKKEIEEALNDLVNLAAQRAMRR